MEVSQILVFLSLLFTLALARPFSILSQPRSNATTAQLSRSDFPKGFVFGTAAAAYQYEGAAEEGGRKASIWDTFSHIPGHIQDGSTGDVATDQYHKFDEDIVLMKNMGLDAYRFSISWSRLYQDKRINPEGLAYYNALINGLKAAGIEPFVTLYHWDLPQALDDSLGGWLNPRIVDEFVSYAEACFEAFGDRVKHWMTFNEPWATSTCGYSRGTHAPGRCSACSKGNSLTEPYIVAHHLILSHAAASKIYREKYQAAQAGKIGIVLDTYWFEPYSDSLSDLSAATRSIDFRFGWFLNPIVYGEYPASMRERIGYRLPEFTQEQTQMLRGSIDFLGLNYYSSRFAQASFLNNITNSEEDSQTLQLTERNGIQIGPRAASTWLYVAPWGLEKLLKYIKTNYGNPTIFITENGMDEEDDPSLTLEQALQDDTRIQYYHDHLEYLLTALRDGVQVKGFFAWSLLDNFEWEFGYALRFGIHYVDYNNQQKRYPKASALWFKHLLLPKGSELLK